MLSVFDTGLILTSFQLYFDRCLVLAEGRRGLRSNQPALPSSERQFMEVATCTIGHMAVAWKVTEEECTCERFFLLSIYY
jgi:hypothetical protein